MNDKTDIPALKGLEASFSFFMDKLTLPDSEQYDTCPGVPARL